MYVTVHSIEDEAVSLSEMKCVLTNLRSRYFVGKLIGELLTMVSRSKGVKWVADKWDQSGLILSNLIDTEQENVDELIKEYVREPSIL